MLQRFLNSDFGNKNVTYLEDLVGRAVSSGPKFPRAHGALCSLDDSCFRKLYAVEFENSVVVF